MVKNKISVWWIVVFVLCFMFSSVIVFFKSKKVEADSRIKIVCSTFPVYDWTSHIVGNDSSSIILSMTEKNGVNYHSFIPTENEIHQIENCQLFVCIGTEKNLMNAAEKTSGVVLNLGNLAKEENPELYKIDEEHIWLSIQNAIYFTEKIAEQIIRIDEENAEKYRANLNRYLNQLETLKNEYKEVFSKNKCKALIICDKNPFGWLFREFDVDYYSALDECTQDYTIEGGIEKFASLQKINYLTGKMDEADTKFLFKLDNSNDKFAHQVIKNSRNPLGDILTLDTMHGATLNETLKGKTYVKVMRSNLEEIKKAL